MARVRPIADDEKIRDMIDLLGSTCLRNEFLFIFQLYTGMRISEILPLRVRDVKNVSCLKIYQPKNKKNREIPLGKDIKKAINSYINGMDDWEFLFKSRNGNKPITRQHANRIYRQAANSLGIERFGCHSPRKDFGAKLYQNTGDIVLVQKTFGHSSAAVTERYIGLTDIKIEEAILDMDFISKKILKK